MEFLAKYKKIILAAGFVVAVFVLGYLLYAVFFKAPAETSITEIPGATTTPSGFPTSPSGTGQIVDTGGTQALPTAEESGTQASEKALGGLTRTIELNNTPSLAVTLSGNGADLQYYNKEDGKFYKIDKNGKITVLTDKVFFDVDTVKWSPNKEKAILEYPDGANILYNFSTNKQATLPSHWKDFDFSPDSTKIVTKSIGLDVNNRWLAISNDDGSKSQAIEEIGDKDATVYPSWSPNNQTIAMYTEGGSFDQQEVFFVGLNGENFKSTVVEGRGFDPKWSPKGDQLLYSVYSSANDLKPMLWVVGAQGDNIGQGRKTLNVETWANKCTFTSDTDLYCAVPKELETGAGLFPELAKNTYDQLYKIDLKTGLKQLVATPDGFYNMSDLIISENGYQLYFTDQTTQKINKINLK